MFSVRIRIAWVSILYVMGYGWNRLADTLAFFLLSFFTVQFERIFRAIFLDFVSFSFLEIDRVRV